MTYMHELATVNILAWVNHSYVIDYRYTFIIVIHKLKIIYLVLCIVVYIVLRKYIERYYKPNATGISIAYNYYVISSLFALASNNLISLYISLELQSITLICLIFALIGLETVSPTVVEAAFKCY